MKHASRSWLNHLHEKIQEKKQRSRFREVSVRTFEPKFDFCSNDYLGLRYHPEVQQAAVEAVHKFGTGAGAASLISGHSGLHNQLSNKLAQWLGSERVLLFPSGFQLNLSVLPSVIQKDHVVLMDRFCHHSLIQGVIASGARFKRFPHNQLDVARVWAEKERGEDPQRVIWLITESVFSMDGDSPDLGKLQKMHEELDVLIYMDEAHGYGVLGDAGEGLLQDDLPFRIGTFGKSFGTQGAFLSTNSVIADYITNFCGGFIYSTAMSPASVGTALAALEVIKSGNNLRAHLKTLVHTFHELMQRARDKACILPEHPSVIYPIVVGDSERAMMIAHRMMERGFGVVAIRPPTVPENTARLRLSFHANHTLDDIKELAGALHNAL